MNINSILADHSKYIEPYSTIRTFHEEIGEILRKREWDSADFKIYTGLDDMTFTRLTKQPGYRFSKRVIVTICIGLELDLGTVERLLDLQGHSLAPNGIDLDYRFLIEKGYTDIEECNKLLTAFKVPKNHHLGTLSKK